MLFQSINKIKRSSIITSLLLIALGVVMIICPGSYTMSLISGMGYAGMILAAVMVLEYLDSKKAFMNGEIRVDEIPARWIRSSRFSGGPSASC